MTKKGEKRDITKVQDLIKKLRDSLHDTLNETEDTWFGEIEVILKRMDASTGKPDSARKKRVVKRQPEKEVTKNA